MKVEMVLPCEYTEMDRSELTYTGGFSSDTLKNGQYTFAFGAAFDLVGIGLMKLGTRQLNKADNAETQAEEEEWMTKAGMSKGFGTICLVIGVISNVVGAGMMIASLFMDD